MSNNKTDLYTIDTIGNWDDTYPDLQSATDAAKERVAYSSSPYYVFQKIAKVERPSDNVKTTIL